MKWVFIALVVLRATSLPAQTIPCMVHPTDIINCPAIGCAVAETPEAAANEVRNTTPPEGRPILLKMDDFERLQATVRMQQGLVAPDRTKFRGLKVRQNMTLSEGDVVSLLGFIVGTPRAHRADPANCLLVGRDSNVFRINIAELRDDTEYDSILAELIPRTWDSYHQAHRRNAMWTLEKLRRLRSEGLKVRVTGKLFYGNKHV